MNRIFTFIIAIMAIVIISLFVEREVMKSKISDGESYTGLYHSEVAKSKQWKDEKDHWRNRATVAEANNKVLKVELQKIRKEFPKINKSFNNFTSFTQLATARTDSFNASLRDTLIVFKKDTAKVKAKHFVWSDGCHTINEVLFNDTAFVVAKSIDSLDIAVYWERNKFMGLRIGKKVRECEIVSKCPNTHIVFNKSIMEKSRKRALISIF